MNYLNDVVVELTRKLTDCPGELIDLYALLAATKGEATTLKDVHEAWGIWKNRINPIHKDLIPYDELTPEVQELDRKYMYAIQTAARSFRG